mgnify:CR=1 FL=1
MKKKIFLVVFLTLFISLISFHQVLAREFEVGWPDLPWMDSPITVAGRGEEVTLAYFISYIFNFALMTVGVVALLMLVVNAIRYMTSTVAPAKRAEAIEGMRNIGYGLLILLASFIILNTINPELTALATRGYNNLIQESRAVVLYDKANCGGNSIGFDEDVGDLVPLGWDNLTKSFKVKNGVVARLCQHVDGSDPICEAPLGCPKFCVCKVYIGDGACKDAAAEGFTGRNNIICAPDTNGVSSLKIEGYSRDIPAILFQNVSLSGG